MAKNFAVVTVKPGYWRGISPEDEGLDLNEDRPHIMPVTTEARKFVAFDGLTGLIKGEITKDGTIWMPAYRFSSTLSARILESLMLPSLEGYFLGVQQISK